jgi:hypothetical protein
MNDINNIEKTAEEKLIPSYQVGDNLANFLGGLRENRVWLKIQDGLQLWPKLRPLSLQSSRRFPDFAQWPFFGWHCGRAPKLPKSLETMVRQ